MKRQLQLLVLWWLLSLALPAQAVIVFVDSAFARNGGLPTDGSPGALVLTRPATTKPGMAMIVSIAARPSRMTWTVPAGWTELSVAAEQLAGGVSTSPGGMTMRTYYKIVGLGEPTSYTWTMANTIGAGASGGGSAVGGLIVYSGLDTSSSPLDATPTSRLNGSGTTHRTNAVTTVTDGAEVVSMISYLSAGSFAVPTCNPAVTPAPTITERLDVRAPATVNAIGTTLQMASFTKATAGVSCATQAIASGDGDTGVGHLMALKPSLRDLTLTMTRSGPLVPGASASYGLSVKNEGVLSEPGPLTVITTLPAGLTYSSFAGSAWTCSVAGAVVTCQRIGALAAGATATTLTINVAVAVGTNGVVTNSAEVSGTGGDGNLFNNTATDSYAILPAPFAYYAFDENANWGTGAGAVPDSSGNGRNATALNTSTVPTFYPPASPPGSAIAGSPGTCGLANWNSTATDTGINTGINVRGGASAIGDAGTIAFWYQSKEAWNSQNRILLDASNSGGGAASHRNFFLIKDSSGRLRFDIEDSSNTSSLAQSPSYTFGAGEWHHVAITWDMTADRTRIYLDGNIVPVGESTTNVTNNLGNLQTLYLGAQRATGLSGAPAYYTSNSLNGYLDELRVYNRALAPLEIAAVKDLTHACSGTPSSDAANFNVVDEQYANKSYDSSGDHRIYTKLAAWDETAGGGSGAVGNTTFKLDVVALNSFAATETNYVSPTGSSKSVSLQIIDDSAGISCNTTTVLCAACSKTVVTTVTPVTFTAADSGYRNDVTVNLGNRNAYSRLIARVVDTNPGTTRYGCSTDIFAVRPTAFSQVTSTASNAGNSGAPVFKAGTDAFTLTARAAALQYTGKPKLDATAMAGRDTALAAGVVGSLTPVVSPTEAANAFPSNTAYANVATTATDATASFRYGEAGSFDLLDKPASAPAVTDTTARGLFDDTWTTVDQAGSGDCVAGSYSNVRSATGRYGCNFGITATTAWFGRFIPDRFELDPATSAIVNRSDVPATSTVGTYAAGATVLSVTPGSGSSFAIGEKIVVMGAGPGGAPLVTTVQAASANTVTLVGPLSTALGGAVSIYRPAAHAFTYVGEPLLVVTGLQAVNGGGAVTQNYTGFAVTDWTTPAASNTLGLGLTSAGGSAFAVDAAAGASGWRTGRASIAVPMTVARGTTPIGPFPTAAIGVAPRDADGVTLATFDLNADAIAGNERKSLGTTALRYGRLRVSNAFGSDKLPLPVPAETQYWTGNFWETNTLDIVGSTLASPTITKTSGAGAVTYSAGSVFSTNAATPGRFGLSLSATGPAAVDLGYTVPAWLQFPWAGGATMQNPTAKASFGLYPGSNRFIYRREVR